MGRCQLPKRFAVAKKRRQAQQENLCPLCHSSLGYKEEHSSCLGAMEIKKVATDLVFLLKGAKIFLAEVRFHWKRITFHNTFQKIREVGILFYESLVRAYNDGVFAVTLTQVVQSFIDGLERLAKILRKTKVFQGKVCLTP